MPVDPVATFGPFLVPGVLFVLGVIGYAILRLLGRDDALGWTRSDRDDGPDPPE